MSKKKPIAENPLIDGKYSHKFLLRLEPHDGGDHLERLLKLTGRATFTSAIKFMLSKYEEVTTLLDKAQTENAKLSTELRAQKNDSRELATTLGRFMEANKK